MDKPADIAAELEAIRAACVGDTTSSGWARRAAHFDALLALATTLQRELTKARHDADCADTNTLEVNVRNDRLTAELARLKEELATWPDRIAGLRDERVGHLEASLAGARAKLLVTYCAYCGHQIAVDDEAGSKISEHIKACPEHPMRHLQADVARLTAERDRLRRRTDELVKALQEVWPIVESAGEYVQKLGHELDPTLHLRFATIRQLIAAVEGAQGEDDEDLDD